MSNIPGPFDRRRMPMLSMDPSEERAMYAEQLAMAQAKPEMQMRAQWTPADYQKQLALEAELNRPPSDAEKLSDRYSDFYQWVDDPNKGQISISDAGMGPVISPNTQTRVRQIRQLTPEGLAAKQAIEADKNRAENQGWLNVIQAVLKDPMMGEKYAQPAMNAAFGHFKIPMDTIGQPAPQQVKGGPTVPVNNNWEKEMRDGMRKLNYTESQIEKNIQDYKDSLQSQGVR
jgi:hypothetical protein